MGQLKTMDAGHNTQKKIFSFLKTLFYYILKVMFHLLPDNHATGRPGSQNFVEPLKYARLYSVLMRWFRICFRRWVMYFMYILPHAYVYIVSSCIYSS